MRDQADKLRQLVRKTIKEHPRLEPGIPFVVLSGGAEGVGTTTVANQLAQELAQLGKRVVLVDANLQQPDIATKLGIEVRGSLTDVLNGNRSVVEVLEPISETIHLLPGRWSATAPPEISQDSISCLLTELRTLNSQADVAIIDAGDGMSPWTSQLWRAAHQILLVTSTNPATVMDSYAAVKHSPFAQLVGRLRLVINQCDDRDTVQHMGSRFASTCQQFLSLCVDEAIAVATNDTADTPGRLRTRTNRLSNAFEQSVRLLAAEVLSSCLVLSHPSESQREDISRKMFKTTNNIQTV